jgi:outer membrane protein assembly factor BamB
MRKYVPGGGFDTSVTFGFDQNQFGNIEIIAALDRIIQQKMDVCWNVGIGGSVWATPLVKDGVVYFGAMDKNFYAVDAETGRELWRFPTGEIIISSAAIDNGIIYFGSFDGCLYAISTEGKLVWKFSAGDKIFSDPFIWKDCVYFGSRNGNVYALEKSTGRPVWVFPTGGPISSCPIVHDGIVYIGSSDKNLYAIDAEAGKLKWKFATSGMVRYTPLFWENRILFGSLDNCMWCVDTNGRLVWSFATNDGISTVQPVVSNNTVFFGSRDMNFYAVDRNGKLLWKYRCRGYPDDAVFLNGLVYLGCCENHLYVLDEKTGRELWTFPTNGFIIRITEHEGRIFFSSWDCHVYCITPAGKLLWKFHTSLGNQAAMEREDEQKTRTFEVIWRPEEEPEGIGKEKKEFSDYGEIKSDYASSGMGDYLGKKKRGYV